MLLIRLLNADDADQRDFRGFQWNEDLADWHGYLCYLWNFSASYFYL